jgi:hypothetical protein
VTLHEYLERFYVWNIINVNTIFWRMVDGEVKGADQLHKGNEALLPALFMGFEYQQDQSPETRNSEPVAWNPRGA